MRNPARLALGLLLLGSISAAHALDAPRQIPAKYFAMLDRTAQIAIAPDGKHFAMLTNRDGRYHVEIHPLGTTSGPILDYPPFDGVFEYNWIHWKNDNRLLAGLAGAGSRGWQGGYIWDDSLETRLASFAADHPDAINAIRPLHAESTGSHVARATVNTTAPQQDGVVDWLPDDPDHILVGLIDHPTQIWGDDVRRIDVNTGEYQYVLGARRYVRHWQSDPKGQIRLGFGTDPRAGEVTRWLQWLDPATGSWRELPSPRYYAEVKRLFLVEDGGRTALVQGKDGGREALLRWDLAEDRPKGTVYVADRGEFIEPIWAPDGSRRIIGALRSGDLSDVFFDDFWTKRMAALHAALPGSRLHLASASQDDSQVLIRAWSARDPGVYYLYDGKAHKLTQIELTRSGLDPDDLAEPRYVRYRARDGLEIQAVLTLPLGASKNLPAVVLPHGGPRAQDYLDFNWLAQFLANRGYAVLQPNFRGSTGGGAALMQAGDRQWGRAMQDDLTDGALWLVEQGYADRGRLAIVGLRDYGAYAALMGAVKTPDLFRCAVGVNGAYDLILQLNRATGGSSDELLAKEIGDPSKDRDALVEASPALQAQKIQVPVLLVHAKDDRVYSFDQSVGMDRALRNAGKPSQLLLLDNGQHGLLNEAARLQFLQALEPFLAQNLAPRP